MSGGSEKERMLAGELYHAEDAQLVGERRRAAEVLARFNAGVGAMELLRPLLGAAGIGSTIRPPFFCDYGYNVELGEGVFLNFGCVLLDVCRIRIGDGTQIGPGVQLYAADHPRDPKLRRSGLENGREVHLGRNVWIGGGARSCCRE